MSELFVEQMERVALMSEGDDTWDLSETDCAALKAILASHDRLLEALKLYAEWKGSVHIGDCPGDDTCACPGKPVNQSVNGAIAMAMKGYR